jgi:hypothetical protein
MLTMTTLRRIWRTSRPLTTTGLLMLGAFGVALVGLWLDPRVITGVPAWLKPAKFAVSVAIYTLSLAWVFTYLPEWGRTRRFVGWTTAIVLTLEVGIIDAQAWRGTTSHFNLGTPLDAVLFSVMGVAIVLQTLASVAVAAALWRQPFADPALGWALRLGMTITIIGAFTGGLMTRPTSAQLAEARVTRQLPVAGGHTIGGPDGGPGLPGTGWSRDHGDLRVPHFIGLHALQALALLLLVVPRRRTNDERRVRVTLIAGGSYLALFVLLLVQALRGEPLLAPTQPTAIGLGLWAFGTALAVGLTGRFGSEHAGLGDRSGVQA